MLDMMRGRKDDDDDKQGPRGARGVNQNAVYFECDVCGHRFQDEPNKDFQTCPQCGEDDTMRI